MSRRIERNCPILLAIFAGVAIALLETDPIGVFSKSVAVGMMTLGIIVAGFAATQRNVLLGLSGSTVLRFIADTGYYHDVLDYFAHCQYVALLMVGISGTRLFIESFSMLGWQLWVGSWMTIFVLMLALMVRNEILMYRIVKRFIENQGSNSKQSKQ